MPSSQNNDNPFDKAFSVIAEGIVKMMPIPAKEKQAGYEAGTDQPPCDTSGGGRPKICGRAEEAPGAGG